MKESEIIKSLNRLQNKPENEWQKATASMLHKIAELDVTETRDFRNSIWKASNFSLKKLMSGVAIALIATLILAGGTAGTALAADASAPGDSLYPLDQRMEDYRRSLIDDDAKLSEYELKLLDERVGELQKVEQKGKDENIERATEQLLQQQDRVRERIRNMENNPNIGEQKKKEIQNQYEKKKADLEEKLNEVKNMYKGKNKENFEETIDMVIEKVNETPNEAGVQEGNQGEAGDQGEGNPESKKKELNNNKNPKKVMDEKGKVKNAN